MDTLIQRKQRAAGASVLAGVFVTAIKAAAAFFSGSLGLMAEAAHSALDALAAVMTWLAVRESSRPPDADHQFGHSKFENLSALGQTVLLALTSVWILYEAIQRIGGSGPHVAPTPWAFLVMGISIVVDWIRGRDLQRIARESSSQALEADALHFRTDVVSSLVVVGGLAGVAYARATGNEWLEMADPIAAGVVAVIVFLLSWRLGRKAADMLVDRAPADATRRVEDALSGLEGLEGRPSARLRQAGDKTFADLVLPLRPGMPVAEGDRIAERARSLVREAVGANASVRVQLEARRDAAASLNERVATAVAAEGGQAHDIEIRVDREGYQADFHLELPGRLSLREAHAIADRVEARIGKEVPEIRRLDIHLEPENEHPEPAARLDDATLRALEKRIRDAARGVDGVEEVHDILLTRTPAGIYLSCHCVLPADVSLAEAHERTDRLEERLRRALPDLARVAVHAEPSEG